MISTRSAALMNLKDYGIEVGKTADLIVVDGTDPAMVVAELAQPMFVFKGGKQTVTRALPELHVPHA